MQAGPSHRVLYLLVPIIVLLLSPGIALGAQSPQVAPEATCPSCDDLNPCTVDTCDTSTGTCRHDPLNCDDANPCTMDFCEMPYPGSGGCTHSNLPDGTACDDGNSCTAGDACAPNSESASQCLGQIQPPGTTCDDRNSCTADDTCNEVDGCAGIPSLPGASCDDGSLCTSNDTCVTAADASLSCKGTLKDCGDNDPCTQDLCDPSTADCGNPPVNCDDGNTCTEDTCDPTTGACVRTFLPYLSPCDDGNPCTGLELHDECQNGNCYGQWTACQDYRACTHDECRLDLGGCIHTPDDSLCPGDGPCTSYFCDPTWAPGDHWPSDGCRVIYQNNNCRSTICVDRMCVGGDCEQWENNGLPCDDNDVCTTNDQCFATSCAGTPLCDDHNVCTTDTCDPITFTCVFTNNTNECGDGNNCTHPDVCNNGTCQSGPLLNCDDGNPCTTDYCTVWGTCSTLYGQCDDHNECTADSCDPATGCLHQPVTGACDDNNRCLLGDVCVAGVCQSGTVVNCNLSVCCDDQNVCTIDSCEPATGCSHEPVTSSTTCGVGACQRTVDTCSNGVPQPCVPGTPTTEVCNGLDDDCDGMADEDGVRADCIINPSTLNLNAQGGMVSMTCKLSDACDPANAVPISGSTVSQVYVSRADSADTADDDVTLPDPSTLPCPDPILGYLYERGISENLEARDVSHANVTFKFNQPSDGNCSTLDGDRADLSAQLAAIPDNTSATVCISGKTEGRDFQACMLVLVRNK